MITLYYDDIGDILFVQKSEPVLFKTCPEDSYVVFLSDKNDIIIGIKLMAASEMPYQYWVSHHSARKKLPEDIQKAVDAWVLKGY